MWGPHIIRQIYSNNGGKLFPKWLEVTRTLTGVRVFSITLLEVTKYMRILRKGLQEMTKNLSASHSDLLVL